MLDWELTRLASLSHRELMLESRMSRLSKEERLTYRHAIRKWDNKRLAEKRLELVNSPYAWALDAVGEVDREIDRRSWLNPEGGMTDVATLIWKSRDHQ